ncbi:MAG TPA: hypothetical protein VN578_10790 [Candidatus Binatia bacterium]|jgi:hypothetical protein|nr:hypothetical protein [Candidatus Binatia bacterium]
MKTKLIKYALSAGLFLGSVAGATAASSIVTFQVDMSVAITNLAFDPLTQSVQVRGNFEGWGAHPVALTNNPLGTTPGLYTGTTNLPLNGSVIAFKYVIMTNVTFETSHNRNQTLPSNSGGSLVIPPAYFDDNPPSPAAVDVTFQVDLAQQINVGAFIPGTSVPSGRGGFNGWSTSTLTNDPTILRTNQNGLVTSNVYVGTFTVSGSPGQTLDYKYYIDTGANWEAPAPNTGDPNDSNNRFFTLSSNLTQTLPIVFFSDQPYAPVATNQVTFQVDMGAQIASGNFDPCSGHVELRGNFNSWGAPQILCTNDWSSTNPAVYKVVIPLSGGVGASDFYKFWSTVSANGGWETMAANRAFQIVNQPAQTLAVAPFDDVNGPWPLPADTVVTFSVSMTNAVGTDGTNFNPASDQVFLNGVPNFAAWNTSLPQLTNNPLGSEVYSLDLLVPKGSPIQQTYKYGIDGNDDEAGAGSNHVRYVRATGRYVMPLDTFGHQLAETNPPVGGLFTSCSTPGNVLLVWEGRPGVRLQTRADLHSGSWLDHPETDGLSATNWPIGSGMLFFRLGP